MGNLAFLEKANNFQMLLLHSPKEIRVESSTLNYIYFLQNNETIHFTCYKKSKKVCRDQMSAEVPFLMDISNCKELTLLEKDFTSLKKFCSHLKYSIMSAFLWQ